MPKAFTRELDDESDETTTPLSKPHTPRSRESKTTSHRAAYSDSKTSDSFCSPGNGRR
jgi:hypothetical protein